MSEEQIDWSRFLPKAELADTGRKTLLDGEVWAFSRGSSSGVVMVEGRIWARVLAGTPPGMGKERTGFSENDRARRAVLVRHSDGRWADGFSAAGPIEAKARKLVAGWRTSARIFCFFCDVDESQAGYFSTKTGRGACEKCAESAGVYADEAKATPAPALPWRSCKEREPRVGDVYSHEKHANAERFEVVGWYPGGAIMCRAVDRANTWTNRTDREAWDGGRCYVWTPREPDAKVEAAQPAKPEPTAAEKRHAEWRRTWKPPIGDGKMVDGQWHPTPSVVANLEVDGPPGERALAGGSILERRDPQWRPRFRSSAPYRSPAKEVTVGVLGDWATDGEGRDER